MMESAAERYSRWEARGMRFYQAARLAWFHELYSPFAFCAEQALEDLLCGALAFHRSEDDWRAVAPDPRALAAHLQQVLGVPVMIPGRFFAEARFQVLSRQPRPIRGVPIFPRMLDELDRAVTDLLELVPEHRVGETARLFLDPHSPPVKLLSRENAQFARLQAIFL